MTFRKWYKKRYVDDADGHLMKMDMESAWNAAIEECAKSARNHPVYYDGNMKYADVVRGEIAIAIEKNREA